MKRLKTFGKYLLLFLAVFIFSRVLIFIGLNSTYGKISLKETAPEGVTISSAKATSVNGEIKGHISEEIKSPYVKFNLYSDLDTLMGSYYISTSELENGNFEFYFKLNYIESYSIEVTNEEPPEVMLDYFSTEEFKGYLLLSAFFTLMFI